MLFANNMEYYIPPQYQQDIVVCSAFETFLHTLAERALLLVPEFGNRAFSPEWTAVSILSYLLSTRN
jgi:hypothetical protein